MITNDYRYLIGCSSVSVKDGGHNAANIYQSLKDQKKIHEINGVRPFNPLPVDKLFNDHLINIPPLLNGYLKLGARIIGKPAWDPEFQTADFLTLLDLDDLPDRYKNHFLKG
jgi:putative hemolysin